MNLLVTFLVCYVAGSYVIDRTVCVWMWRRHYRQEAQRDLAVGYKRSPTPGQVYLEKRRTGGWKPNPIFPLGLMGFK